MWYCRGWPSRCEAKVFVDCSVAHSAMMDCGFEVYIAEKCDSYPHRQEVAAVVDSGVDQSAVVDCEFTANGAFPHDG